MLFSKLFNYLNHLTYFIISSAIEQVAASISAYFHRSCLFLAAVILLPEKPYTFSGGGFKYQFCGRTIKIRIQYALFYNTHPQL